MSRNPTPNTMYGPLAKVRTHKLVSQRIVFEVWDRPFNHPQECILSGCATIGTFAQSLLEECSTVTTPNLDYLADDFLFPVDFLRYWLDCRLSTSV